MNRVAFIGQQRAGKDTAADLFLAWATKKYYISEESVARYSLAAPIKELVTSAYGDQRSMREPCQYIGAALRKYDKNFWVKILKRKVFQDKALFAAITDVRYPNECVELSKLGFTLIGISAPNEERYLRSGRDQEEWEEAERHESETHARACLLDAPYTVKNDGALDEFRKRLVKILESDE